VTAWFSRVGMPLSLSENAAIGELMGIVAPHVQSSIKALATWQEAATFVRVAEHDATWWDDEEEEREALWARASENRSEAELFQRVNAMTHGLERALRDAASAAAKGAGVADPTIAMEAAGSAMLAAHQNALAGMAGEGRDHRFVRKYGLFTGGRWPLGYHSARFIIF
jgi:hypothetical protein